MFEDIKCNLGDECCKRFIKTNKLLHFLHLFHNIFTIIIWVIILVLLIDYYYHIIPHNSHEYILWSEFICYTLFILIPISVYYYKKYKITKCKNQ